MATEDTDTEEGGQTDDGGEPAEDTESDVEGGEKAAASDDAPKAGRPGARDKRRGDRYREANERATAAENRAAEAERRAAALEGQFNEFRQSVERDRQQAQQTNASTEAKTRVYSLRQQARNYLIQASQAQNNPELAQKLIDKHDELMDQADDLRDEMRDGARWEKRRGELQANGPNAEVIAERTYLEGRYPWLSTNAEARALADARFSSLVGSGKPANRATMEVAITYAARTLGIGGQSAPSQRSRQVYAGMGQRDGEADDSAPSGGMTADDVKNNLPLRRMALASFNEDDPEVAYAKFAKLNNQAEKRNGVSR